MTGIAEMFAELDGYTSYWTSIAIRGAYVLANARAYQEANRPKRNARIKQRYWTVPGVRERHLAAQRRYQERRRDLGIVKRKIAAQHGTASKYVKGCRCDACRAASASYMRQYRARRAS